MYVWTPLKQNLLPTVADLKQIYPKADDEDPKVRDQRPLMSLLMRLTQADARLGGHIMTRRTAVSSFGWQIMGEAATPEQLAAATTRLRAHIDRLLDWHTDTPMYGASAVEQSWQPTEQGMTPTVLRRYKPVEIDRSTSGLTPLESLTIVDDAGGKRPLATETPDAWVVDVDESFEAGGLLRRLILPEILRNDMLREWATTGRKIKGLLELIYTEGAEDTDLQPAVEAAQKLIEKNISVHSDAIQSKFTQVVSSEASRTFQDIISALDTLIAIGVLGQANTAELPKGGGSRAALQVLNLIRADIHYADIARIQRQINQQVILPDYRFNFDLAAIAAPWEFRITIPEEIDLEARSRVLVDLISTNVPVIAREAYQWLGLTMPDGAPEILGAAAAPGTVMP